MTNIKTTYLQKIACKNSELLTFTPVWTCGTLDIIIQIQFFQDGSWPTWSMPPVHCVDLLHTVFISTCISLSARSLPANHNKLTFS